MTPNPGTLAYEAASIEWSIKLGRQYFLDTEYWWQPFENHSKEGEDFVDYEPVHKSQLVPSHLQIGPIYPLILPGHALSKLPDNITTESGRTAVLQLFPYGDNWDVAYVYPGFLDDVHMVFVSDNLATAACKMIDWLVENGYGLRGVK